MLHRESGQPVVRDAITSVTEALKADGFGLLTNIDVRESMKSKLNRDVWPYRILDACDPQLAHKALTAEDKIGTTLPCNVIDHECGDGHVEVAVIDPVPSMAAVDNRGLTHLAASARRKPAHTLDTFQGKEW